ncbi:MAPEG family protein [Sphingomonas montana]|uniref:MAPEG family protein n=1 Tax=Sphingomonas montana TaxID=1843236 RepID=UPI00096E17F4|nr:MAPEG family protein [Sphingomonas montana]
MTLTYTLMFAVAFALINLWLAFRAGKARLGAKVSIGDGGNPLLTARMRAQANFLEYVPLALILIGLIEMRVGASQLLFALGIALVLARIAHAFGMERPTPNPLRAGGILVTFAVTAALIVWGAMLLYGFAG